MNYEILLLNAIADSKDFVTCIEQDVGSVFHAYRDIWEFIVQFHGEYGTVPSKDAIKARFDDFDAIKTDSPLQFYIDDAKSKSLSLGLREALRSASMMIQGNDPPEAIISTIQSEMSSLIRESGRMQDTNVIEWRDRANDLRERIDSDDGKTLGIPSGISVIDAYFGGWQPGDFVVVMGWSGVGKSLITRLFAVNAWRAGYTPLIISLEMDREQEQYRIDTIINHGQYFTNSQLVTGKGIDIDTYEKWASDTFDGKHPIYLVTSDGIDSADQHFVQAKIDQFNKPPLVILDYHGLFEDTKSGSEVEKAKNLSKAFKHIAMRNRVAVIDISAVTMEQGKHDERPPLLSEMAWSKQLVYDADLVLAVHRNQGSDIFQIVSRKTRRCQEFAFYLKWDIDSGKWEEIYEIE